MLSGSADQLDEGGVLSLAGGAHGFEPAGHQALRHPHRADWHLADPPSGGHHLVEQLLGGDDPPRQTAFDGVGGAEPVGGEDEVGSRLPSHPAAGAGSCRRPRS